MHPLNSNQNFRLKCGTVISLVDLESAQISFVPCGKVNGKDQPLLSYAHLWGHRRRVTRQTYGKKWNPYTTRDMNGVQLMTGFPTYKHGDGNLYLYYTSLDIERRMIETFPDEVAQIRTLYQEHLIGSPCILSTKSDGLRLDAYTEYVGKKMSFKDAEDKMLFEVLAEKCLTRIDARYAMVSGSLLEIPTLPKETLQDIYHIINTIATEESTDTNPRTVVESSQLGDLNLEWDTNGLSQYFPTQHCQRTSHKSNRDGTVIFQKHADGSVHGKCFNCGETWWEIEPTKPTSRQAPIRLEHQTDYTPESETLERLREAMPKGLLEWVERTAETETQHMLILAYGAGTGKSTTTLVNLPQYADISPTLELADEKYEKALAEGKNAMRHRSRNYNREASENLTPFEISIGLEAEFGDVPCAFPDICNGLAELGYSPSRVFCPSCPRFDECRADGYLSQWREMPKHDALFFSYQDDFFSDPQYQKHIENITKDDDVVLVLDEVDPASLPPKRSYTTEHLKQLIKDFEGFDVSVFLKMLIEKTAAASAASDWANAVKELLTKFDDPELEDMDTELQGIPAKVVFEKAKKPLYDLKNKRLYNTIAHLTYGNQTRTCAVLSRRKGEKKLPIGTFETLSDGRLDWVSDRIFPPDGWKPDTQYPTPLTINTFCRLGFGAMDTPESVARLPKQLTNFTADLREFIESVNSETPACHEDKEGKGHLGWSYYLRPSMNARRGVIISASGVEGIIKELYKHTDIDIETLTGKPPAWKEGNVIIQLSTGRYSPARSLIDCDKEQNYKAIGLRDRGRELLQIITTEVSENGKPTLVVGPKDFTPEGDLTHLPEIANLLELPNVSVINHHHAEGVNQYDHCQDAFVFLYEPRPDEFQKIVCRIIRDKSLCFEREQIRLKKAGMELEEVYRYKDPDVQTVYDKECEKRSMQALTRLRQMIHKGKRVYLFTSEPVSGLPITPILCTIDDLKACQAEHGTLDALETYLESKANRSVTEIAEQDNVSERTAYRRTETQRTEAKAELVKCVLEMKGQRIGERKIAKELGISYGKVRSIVKEHEVH